MFSELGLEKRPEGLEEAERGSREKREVGHGLGQVDITSALLLVLCDHITPHSVA